MYDWSQLYRQMGGSMAPKGPNVNMGQFFQPANPHQQMITHQSAPQAENGGGQGTYQSVNPEWQGFQNLQQHGGTFMGQGLVDRSQMRMEPTPAFMQFLGGGGFMKDNNGKNFSLSEFLGGFGGNKTNQPMGDTLSQAGAQLSGIMNGGQ